MEIYDWSCSALCHVSHRAVLIQLRPVIALSCREEGALLYELYSRGENIGVGNRPLFICHRRISPIQWYFPLHLQTSQRVQLCMWLIRQEGGKRINCDKSYGMNKLLMRFFRRWLEVIMEWRGRISIISIFIIWEGWQPIWLILQDVMWCEILIELKRCDEIAWRGNVIPFI